MTREEVLPEVQKALNEEVENIIKQELDNMRALAGFKSKKKGKKKGKGKKKAGRKKGKKIKLPGAKLVNDMTDYDILKQLIGD